MAAFFNISVLPQITELMAKGATPVQVAAAMHISKQDFQEWLMNPDPKYNDLRKVVELGLTEAEAYWETRGQQAILGQIRYFRESTYKLFMENRFKWTEKTETQQIIKSSEQLLSNEALDEQLKAYLEKYTNDSSPRISEASSGETEEGSGK